MRIAVRVSLATLAALTLWTVLIAVGSFRGWGREPIAPRGDTRAFLDAAAARIDSRNAGNAVLTLLEDGRTYGAHAVSVGEPVDRDTVFQVASLSKWITAWGVMALSQAGQIDLDAPVGTYLERWSLPPSDFDNDAVTVRRLLSHTAGLTDGLGYAGFAPDQPLQTLEQSLTRAADAVPGASGIVRVGYEPGTGWRYSGGGYTLLQLLIEEVSGESFEDYMQRVVLRPLGMTHSTFHWTPESGTRLATFYDVDSKPAVHYRFTALAAASLYTTASDLTRFLQANLPGPNGEPLGRGVLDPATVDEMRRAHGSRLGRDIWGLGTMLYARNAEGGFVVGHDGNNGPAINTAARLDPATGNGIVVLATGTPGLASTVGGEWVFWETGNVDFLALVMGANETLRTLVLGALGIGVGGALIAWRGIVSARAHVSN